MITAGGYFFSGFTSCSPTPISDLSGLVVALSWGVELMVVTRPVTFCARNSWMIFASGEPTYAHFGIVAEELQMREAVDFSGKRPRARRPAYR